MSREEHAEISLYLLAESCVGVQRWNLYVPMIKLVSKKGVKKMKKTAAFITKVLTLTFIILALYASAANSQDWDRSYRASKIIGLWVANHEGRYFGRIQDLVFDREGHVIFAIIGYSKFNWKRIDQNSVAVPFKALGSEWNTKSAMVMTDINWQEFKSAPRFTEDDLMNRQKQAEIYRYFGQQPYWTEHHVGK